MSHIPAMGLSPKLVLRQSQTLAITPQLMQAIKLLQFSSLELSQFIDKELVQNPLLERDERAEGPINGDSEFELSEPVNGSGTEETANLSLGTLDSGPQAIADTLDTSAENVFPEDPAQGAAPATDGERAFGMGMGSGQSVAERPDFDHYISRPETLHDHLGAQLAIAIKDPSARIIGTMLIDAIDDNGYLQTSPEDVAERLQAPLAKVVDVLSRIQRFDPVGIGARNLAECLALQL
ncbi:MAG: RNA polymerase sigma-54 factor, partial [Pseudomonadota bacterium]